jgi:electron transfer flavoprotein alpha subunit
MSFELLGIGKTLANGLGSGVCAFVIGENVGNAAKEAFQYGASKVYAVEGAIFKGFNAEAYSKAASFLLEKYKPEAALFRATSQGTDVAAASAAKLGFGLCTDSIGLKVEGGQIKLTRAAFGGNYSVTVVNEKAKPQIATLRPKAFAMPENDS